VASGVPHLEGARLPAYPYESSSRLTNSLNHPSSPQDHFPPFPEGKWGEQKPQQKHNLSGGKQPVGCAE
jgi:hypothetical protein